MKEYKIIHKEELVGWFYVEADNAEEALDEYNRMVQNGEIDFSDMEMVDSCDTAVVCNEDE